MLLVLSLAACGGEIPASTENSTPGTTATQNTQENITAATESTEHTEATENTENIQLPTQNETVEHTHSYEETVTAPACEKDGAKTYTCACGDSYADLLPATGHSWGQWATVKEPTTSAEGTSRRECGKCSATESKTLPKLTVNEPPHQHSYTGKITKNPGCTQTGVKTYTCTCGDSYTDTVAATGHSFSQWTTVRPATETAEGVSQRKCGNCGKTESKSISKLPHTHSYTSKITTEPTCTTHGVTTFTCACGNSYTDPISPTGHNWGDWTTTREPTATVEGVSLRKCGSCNMTQSKTLPKLPAPEPGQAPVTQAQLQKIEEYFLALVNEERVRVGVSPLSIDPHLDSAALIRSSEIIDLFSHTRPDGTSFHTALDHTAYQFQTIGENICMTTHVGNGLYSPDNKWVGSDAQLQAVAYWNFTLFKNSPGHYANMIKAGYVHCGIGITYDMYTEEIPMFYLAHIFGAKFG